MDVVNRCALSVSPLGPMVQWSRPFQNREDMEGLGEETSLYLIPTYESEEEAEALLRENFETIFAAELDLWCADRSLWPEPRTYERFREWFELRLFPLVEDLGSEPLGTYAIHAAFREEVERALE